MKKLIKSPLVAAMGTAVVSTLAATTLQANTNPFAVNEMTQGYMQLAQVVPYESGAKSGSSAPVAEKKTEGSCGEGKCGAMMDGGKMKPGMENTCGAMMKGKEGACGAMNNSSAPAASSDSKAKSEMSCGASMKGGSGEMSCGANMKGGSMDSKAVEGKCAGKM